MMFGFFNSPDVGKKSYAVLSDNDGEVIAKGYVESGVIVITFLKEGYSKTTVRHLFLRELMKRR